MPTTDAPKMQPPMEAAHPNPASLQTGGGKAVVTSQPTSEPRPSTDGGDMAMRGGGMNHYCGFSCCKGRCNFRLC